MNVWVLAVIFVASPPAAPLGQAASLSLNPNWMAFLQTRTLRPQPLPSGLALFGKVTFDEDKTQHVAAPMGGRIAQVFVDLGANVTAGTPLLALAAPEAAALQGQAQVALQAVAMAKRNWLRMRGLRTDGAVSDKEVAQAEDDYKHAQVEHQALLAQQHAVGLAGRGVGPSASAAAGVGAGDRAQLILAARQAGTVVSRTARVGQQVHAESGEALLTISNLDDVWVIADLYEQDLHKLQLHQAASVHVAAYPDEAFAGDIAYISDVLDAETRTLKVRCRVSNPNHRLKPQMYARVVPAAGHNEGLVVPAVAVVRDHAQTFVLVLVDSDHAVQQRAVRLGPAQHGEHQVLGGLVPGERIVTDGALFVHHALHFD